jgi:plastocyanin
MFNRIRLEITAAAALALALAAFLIAMRDTSSPAETADQAALPTNATAVQIAKFAYAPEPVRVQAGRPVAWTNLDSTPHTVTAEDNSWDSGLMDQGETFVLTFDEPGVYEYICALHPPRLGLQFAAPAGEALAGGGGHGMRGTVIVE